MRSKKHLCICIQALEVVHVEECIRMCVRMLRGDRVSGRRNHEMVGKSKHNMRDQGGSVRSIRTYGRVLVALGLRFLSESK